MSRCYWVAAGLALAATTGCGVSDRDAGTERHATGRNYRTTAWDTVFRIGGEENDSILLLPRLIATGPDLLYVYDYGDQQLKAFDYTGQLLWRYGRSGEGPGEFINPIDLEASSANEAWLFDGGTGRLTVITADGDTAALLRPGVAIRDILPLQGRTLATPVVPGDQYWIELDEHGQPSSRGAFPLAELAQAPPAARQTYSVIAPNGSTWATIFPFGNVVLIHDNLNLRCTGRLVEGAGFQAVPVAEMTVWAAGATLSDSIFYVLARGNTDEALSILDEYSIQDCRYIGTIRLPRKVRTARYREGVFYIAYEDPAPAIIGIRPRGP